MMDGTVRGTYVYRLIQRWPVWRVRNYETT